MNTCEAAKLGFLEDRKGRIAPGMDADLVVLDRDPYEAAEESVESLSDIKVLKTFRSGVEVYDSETFRPAPKRSLPGAVAAIAAKKIAGALRR